MMFLVQSLHCHQTPGSWTLSPLCPERISISLISWIDNKTSECFKAQKAAVRHLMCLFNNNICVLSGEADWYFMVNLCRKVKSSKSLLFLTTACLYMAGVSQSKQKKSRIRGIAAVCPLDYWSLDLSAVAFLNHVLLRPWFEFCCSSWWDKCELFYLCNPSTQVLWHTNTGNC